MTKKFTGDYVTKKEFLGEYKVQKVNETFMVTIPKPFARAINLEGGKEGDKVRIYREGDKLIIEKAGE